MDGASVTFELQRVSLDEDVWPFGTGSFDAVLCWEVLEHLFHDPAFAMLEARRVLVHGGLLQVTTPNPDSCRTLSFLLAGEQTADFVAINAWGVAHPHELSLGYMRRLVEGSGFEVEAHGTWQDDLGPDSCDLTAEDPACSRLPAGARAALLGGRWKHMHLRTRQYLTARATKALGGQRRFPANLHYNPTMFPMAATVARAGARPWHAFPEAAPLADGVARAVEAPNQSAPQHRVVYLSHVHKTGGSSLCKLATGMELRVPPTYPDTWGNCNFNCSMYSSLYRAVATDAPLAVLSSLDFIANEAPLVPVRAPTGTNIVHMLVLREPCARTISHFEQERPIWHNPFRCLTPRCKIHRNTTPELIDVPLERWFRLRRSNHIGIGCSAHAFYRDGFSTLDDFQLRFVCGSQCSNVPFGRMRPIHLAAATGRLQQLRIHAITLELLSTPPGWQHMRGLLGGKWSDVPSLPRIGEGRPIAHRCAREVQEHLQLDGRLHTHVSNLHELRYNKQAATAVPVA